MVSYFFEWSKFVVYYFIFNFFLLSLLYADCSTKTAKLSFVFQKDNIMFNFLKTSWGLDPTVFSYTLQSTVHNCCFYTNCWAIVIHFDGAILENSISHDLFEPFLCTDDCPSENLYVVYIMWTQAVYCMRQASSPEKKIWDMPSCSKICLIIRVRDKIFWWFELFCHTVHTLLGGFGSN